MNEIIESKQIEIDKSSFVLDLVKHDSSITYVEITQSIHSNSDDHPQKIKINPIILSDFIKILENYHSKIEVKSLGSRKHLNTSDKEKIITQYLKGVSIKDLALLQNQSKDVIEFVLRNNNIEIVPNKIPRRSYWKKSRKRK
jgi:hypothetical protein